MNCQSLVLKLQLFQRGVAEFTDSRPRLFWFVSAVQTSVLKHNCVSFHKLHDNNVIFNKYYVQPVLVPCQFSLQVLFFFSYFSSSSFPNPLRSVFFIGLAGNVSCVVFTMQKTPPNDFCSGSSLISRNNECHEIVMGYINSADAVKYMEREY